MNDQKIILAGNATKDPEQKISKDGKVKFMTFRLGVADSKEKSTFFAIQ